LIVSVAIAGQVNRLRLIPLMLTLLSLAKRLSS